MITLSSEEALQKELEALSHEQVGQWLKELREAAGVSQAAAARVGPVSRGGLRLWEEGEPGVAVLHYALALARVRPQARFVLLQAAGVSVEEASTPSDPELQDLLAGVMAAWQDREKRSIVRSSLDAIGKLADLGREKTAATA